MQTGGIVDVFNEGRQVSGNVLESLVVSDMDGLDLQGLHEALGLGVVVRVASPAHRPDEAAALDDAPMPGSGVLRSAVGVQHAAGKRTAGLDCGVQSAGRQPDVDVPAKSIAHHLARPGIEDDGQIGEAGRNGDVGDVTDKELVRAVNLVVQRHVRVDRAVVIAVRGRDVSALRFQSR